MPLGPPSRRAHQRGEGRKKRKEPRLAEGRGYGGKERKKHNRRPSWGEIHTAPCIELFTEGRGEKKEGEKRGGLPGVREGGGENRLVEPFVDRKKVAASRPLQSRIERKKGEEKRKTKTPYLLNLYEIPASRALEKKGEKKEDDVLSLGERLRRTFSPTQERGEEGGPTSDPLSGPKKRGGGGAMINCLNQEKERSGRSTRRKRR